MNAILTPTVGTWLAAIFTLFIFSILYKENPFYRIAEHVFVAVTAAHSIVVAYNAQIKTTFTVEIAKNGQYWLLIPIAIGLMVYLRVYKPLAWLSRIPIALWMGYGAGMALTVRTVVPFTEQVMKTMLPLVVFNKTGGFDLMQSFNNTFFVFGAVGVLTYFFFTKEQKGVLKVSATFGRWVMMIGFGAAFGNTVMSRVSLFLGRMQFLMGPWLGIIK